MSEFLDKGEPETSIENICVIKLKDDEAGDEHLTSKVDGPQVIIPFTGALSLPPLI